MGSYKKILIAVELKHDEDIAIVAKAKAATQSTDTQLHLIHAVEHINTYGTASAYPAIADIEQQISDEHRQQLAKLADELGITQENTDIDIGPPSVIIADKAKQLDADLIVVGNHGRHGIALLLGSTADSILHKADCDILVVKL